VPRKLHIISRANTDEEDARNVLQGAERCDIILKLARGLNAKSLARSRYKPPHKQPGFKEMWAKAEREEDEDRVAELVKLIEDKFSRNMDECTSIVVGPSGDGYASCAHLIQGHRQVVQSGEIFPEPWWQRTVCGQIDPQVPPTSDTHRRTDQLSSPTYVPRSQRAGSFTEIGSSVNETENLTAAVALGSSNPFIRIHRAVQRDGVVGTFFKVMLELAQSGARLMGRVLRPVSRVLRGTVSALVGALLAFPSWALSGWSAAGFSDDGKYMWPWCWVETPRGTPFSNKRVCHF